MAVAIGAALRLALLGAKPFWRDEAWVASVVELPQAARSGVQHVLPPGFLAAVRAAAWLLPAVPPEIAYRLVPAAAGLLTMLILPLVARRCGAPASVVVSTAWLAAGTPALVYYSRELKPYALDLLWAALLLLVLLAARPADDARGAGGRTWLAVAVLAAAAPWASHGAVFPAAAAVAWMAWHTLRRARARAAVAAAIVTTLVFMAAVASAYLIYLRRQIAHPLLPLMWDDALQPAGLGAALMRALFDVGSVPVQYLFPGAWPLAAVLAVVGAATLPSNARGALLWCWLGSALLAAGCAAARLYLVAQGRFLLFLAPGLVVCVAAGLARCCDAALRRVGRRAGAWAAVALSAAWAAAWAGQSLHRRAHPDARPRPFVFDVVQEVGPLIDWLQARHVPPSTVVVGRYAADPFRYYARGRLAGALPMGFGGHAYGAEFAAALAGKPDGWLLLAAEEEGSYRRALEAQSFRVERMAAARGAVVLRFTREASPRRTRADTRDAGGARNGPGP